MKKFMNVKTLIGVVGALIAGISAFGTEWENKKQADKIEDMEIRLAELENKKES